MIIGMNKSRTLIKHVSCKCKCKMVENVSYTKIGLTIRVSVGAKIQKNIACDKGYFWNPVACNSENGKYTGSIIGDPVVICNEIIDVTNSTSTKTVPAKCTLTNFHILLSFSIIDSCQYLHYKPSSKTKTFCYHIMVAAN